MNLNFMKLTSTVLKLLCLGMVSTTQAAEVITYTLARGSTITYSQGGKHGEVTEPLSGSFDWTRCPDDGVSLCFDAIRMDLESPSFVMRVASIGNDLATSVIVGTNVSCFGKVVDVTNKVNGNTLTSARILEVFESESTACGKYQGPATHPARLIYTQLLLEGVGPMKIFAFTGPDSDGDGVPDSVDVCGESAPGAAVDSDGCSIDQLVPCAGPRSGGRWKNHGQYVAAVVKTAHSFHEQGLITKNQELIIIREAIHSDCGKK